MLLILNPPPYCVLVLPLSHTYPPFTVCVSVCMYVCMCLSPYNLQVFLSEYMTLEFAAAHRQRHPKVCYSQPVSQSIGLWGASLASSKHNHTHI